jgi:carbon storage regulator
MLVLTRKPGEQIVINGNIRITVVGVGPGRVKIGVEAPANVRVDRAEIYEKIQREVAESVDVLDSLTRSQPDDASPTMIASSDTSLTLHNRIAETLTEMPDVVEAVVLPRKSR